MYAYGTEGFLESQMAIGMIVGTVLALCAGLMARFKLEMSVFFSMLVFVLLVSLLYGGLRNGYGKVFHRLEIGKTEITMHFTFPHSGSVRRKIADLKAVKYGMHGKAAMGGCYLTLDFGDVKYASRGHDECDRIKQDKMELSRLVMP